ncbi:MAG: hypothetical protein EP305_11755 [Bacteroidetes bacterium]|nr:MAG: hypothetical protein EP305_11755 [Bacteroidota bacterium]
MKKIKFLEEPENGFYRTLQARVENYFVENNISRYGNWKSALKFILFFGIMSTFYSLMILSEGKPVALFLFYWFMIGAFVIFSAASVIHDATHNVLSRHQWVNELFLRYMNLVGADGYIYRYKHNVAHHPYTNIPGIDVDLEQSNVVRVTPYSKKLKSHKYQDWYMKILYPFYFTVFWLIFRDFRYYKMEYVGTIKTNHNPWHQVLLVVTKIVYFTIFLIIPMIVLPVPFWLVLIGFFILHLGSGFVAMFALLSNHVVEDSLFVVPDENGLIHCSWGEHQFRTTDDYSPDSAFISYMFSGLNHHVAHHLFPNYCNHIHLPAVTKIVRETAEEFGLKYRYNSIHGGLMSHFRLLTKLKNNEVVAVTR